ncbi:MAG TPA: hypothetical protein VFH59_05485 [Frateuria sp.]|uniref:hypothetical protein n=1 Tax=Frateuria sp. TaxID=2211372 RepID=UPI002D7F8C3D|nr:hypothetical protein [Frateuria sp.]HET6804880.1 hypothetical protein [Frateuria sp.]
MPLLDVSEVLLDPDFADSLVCTRQSQTVGNDGMAVNTTTDTDFVGVVTAASGNNLVRTPEGAYTKGDICIITTYRLRASATGDGMADVVTWNGTRYTVTQVNDYSRYGSGFVWAVADIIPLGG